MCHAFVVFTDPVHDAVNRIALVCDEAPLGAFAGAVVRPIRAVAEVVAAVTHATSVNSVSRWGSIALFAILGVRIVRNGAMRILALISLALITLAFFGDELLDPIGVPGIWFPFGIGVSRTQYVYAFAIPLLACLIARDLPSQ